MTARRLVVAVLAWLVLTGTVGPAVAIGPGADTVGPTQADTHEGSDIGHATQSRCGGNDSAAGRTDQPTQDEQLPEPLRAVGVGRAHARGYTGEGAVVAVVDFGFDIEGSAIEESVTARVDLTGKRDPTTTERAHGTAVAEIVTMVAPDAKLVVVSVKPSPESVRAAVDRLDPATEPTAPVDASEIDALVLPFGDERAGAPIDGTNQLDWRVSRFVAQTDTPVFVAAGNTPDHSWSDTFDPTAEGYHTFATGKTWQRVDGTADLRFHWYGPDPETTNVTVELVALEDGKPVSSAEPLLEKTVGFDEIPASVRAPISAGDQDALAVRIHSESADPGTRLALFGSRPLGFATTRTSILSPATAHESVAVGVATPNGTLVETSVAGPTIDGRRGLDIVAPAGIETETRGVLSGSSGAVPVVGGTAALVAARTNLSHKGLERRLFETAAPGPERPTPRLGHGVVNVSRAAWSVSPLGRVLFAADRLGTARSPLRAVPSAVPVPVGPLEWGLSALVRLGQSVEWSQAC